MGVSAAISLPQMRDSSALIESSGASDMTSRGISLRLRHLAGAIALAWAVCGRAALAQTPVGTAFTYQGVLEQAGAAYNGTADVQFLLFDAAAAGNQIGSTLALNGVAVSDGLLTATLDFGAPAFGGSARWLEIRVHTPSNGGGGPYTTLSPRQQLRAVPYAMYSLGGSGQWGVLGQSLNYTAGNVSVGTTNQSAKVTIYPSAGDGGTQVGLYVRNTDTSNQTVISQFVSESGQGIGVLGQILGTSGTGRAISGSTASVNGYAIYGIATATSGTNYGVYGQSNSPTGWAGYFNGRGYVDGPLLVGRTNTIGAEIFGIGEATSAFSGMYASTNSDGEPFYGYSAGGDADAYHYYNSADDSWRLVMGATRMTVLGSNGSVGINTTAPAGLLHVNGTGDSEPSGGGVIVVGLTSSGNISIDGNEIMARDNGGTSTLFLNNDGGDVSVSPAGTGRLITRVLQITGGSDLSEQFEVSARDIDPQPGMVVVIDPENPGQLVPATAAYDKKVAGVISGAGGVATGMMMGHSGTIADGAHAVALTGRVYCLVDAADCAIEPGDMLTTSATPGHAMKASDEGRSHGAVIGKAMTALPRGEKGLVLVLVNLQ
jgi:hypothetical protein